MVERVLIIEGTSDSSNGNLRQAFSKLLAKKLENRMVRIKMGDGKSQAIASFKKQLPGVEAFLLIDLDDNESRKNENLQALQLSNESHRTFFMIQEMEAWLISQPEVLETLFEGISSKIPKRPASEIENPKDKLFEWTRSYKTASYSETKHGAELLPMLDPDKLSQTFPDFKNLIEKLSE